jgi:hypothetical protein
MTVDLTPATSLSTVADHGLATSRGILNSAADITPAGPASHPTEERDQFSGREEPAVISGGRGSQHCAEVQRTADEAVTTVASPLGEPGRTAHVLRAAQAIW